MKFAWLTNPRVWVWLMAVHAAVVGSCLVSLYLTETWDNWSIANAAIAGFSAASAYNAHLHQRLSGAFQLMHMAYEQLNRAFAKLLAARAEELEEQEHGCSIAPKS
jgi:hypothetical protein